MAIPTRAQVVERAELWFDRLAYLWGAFPSTMTQVWCNANGDTQTSPNNPISGPYYGTDCSGYTSWCWYLRSHVYSGTWGPTGAYGGARYRAKSGSGNTYESLFLGIQPGDVLWRSGHVAIYIGNNTILHASTRYWKGTTSQHGMQRQTSNFNFNGYCSYDGTFSEEYDPEEIPDPAPSWNQGDRLPGEPANAPNGAESDEGFYYTIANLQYTKRRTLMKLYRR